MTDNAWMNCPFRNKHQEFDHIHSGLSCFKPLFYVFVLFSHGVADEDSGFISSAVMWVCIHVTPTQTMTCIIPKDLNGMVCYSATVYATRCNRVEQSCLRSQWQKQVYTLLKICLQIFNTHTLYNHNYIHTLTRTISSIPLRGTGRLHPASCL